MIGEGFGIGIQIMNTWCWNSLFQGKKKSESRFILGNINSAWIFGWIFFYKTKCSGVPYTQLSESLYIIIQSVAWNLN